MSETKKVCLITGGTSGIGLETAKLFLQKGYNVFICSIEKEEVVSEVLKELQTLGEVSYGTVDVSDEGQCEKIVAKAMGKYGRIDVLVNVAGITEPDLFLKGNFEGMKRVLDIDLIGTLCMCKYAAKAMIPHKRGVIVNISSMCSVIVNAAEVGYHSAKAGVTRATQVLAKELADYNIRCVSVAPAWVRTRLIGAGTDGPGGMLHLRKRILEPKEVADVIYLMTTDEAVAINGSQILADDGLCGFKTLDRL